MPAACGVVAGMVTTWLCSASLLSWSNDESNLWGLGQRMGPWAGSGTWQWTTVQASRLAMHA